MADAYCKRIFGGIIMDIWMEFPKTVQRGLAARTICHIRTHVMQKHGLVSRRISMISSHLVLTLTFKFPEPYFGSLCVEFI